MQASKQKAIEVWAHWAGMEVPCRMGKLYAAPGRSKEIFSFSYDPTWLKSGQSQLFDPDLQLYSGPQYAREDHDNFGL